MEERYWTTEMRAGKKKKKIKAYLDKKGVKLLPWTAKMADLNPIEHARGATQSVIWNKELINPRRTWKPSFMSASLLGSHLKNNRSVSQVHHW